MRGFAHAFLTARVNWMVSTGAPPGGQPPQKKECWKQSKCLENNTHGESDGAGLGRPDKRVIMGASERIFRVEFRRR
jgi:hypothetical protein